MEYSLAFRKEAKKLGVVESMLAMADLMAVGYKDVDAYKVCYTENAKYPDKQQKSIMENILASAKFKKLLDSRKARVKEKAIPVNLDEVSLIGDEEIAREILRSAMSTPVGSKERADLLLKYNEVLHQNDVETTDDATDTINFYFPVKCSQCLFYNEFMKMAKDTHNINVAPVDMDGIMRESVKKAYPNAIEAYEKLHGHSYAKAMRITNEGYEKELELLKKKYGL